MTTDRDGPLTAAYARWLTDHGVPDPATAAAELVLMARGHGWRPIEALQPPPQSSGGRRELPAEYLARKAALTRSDPERRSR